MRLQQLNPWAGLTSGRAAARRRRLRFGSRYLEAVGDPSASLGWDALVEVTHCPEKICCPERRNHPEPSSGAVVSPALATEQAHSTALRKRVAGDGACGRTTSSGQAFPFPVRPWDDQQGGRKMFPPSPPDHTAQTSPGAPPFPPFLGPDGVTRIPRSLPRFPAHSTPLETHLPIDGELVPVAFVHDALRNRGTHSPTT